MSDGTTGMVNNGNFAPKKAKIIGISHKHYKFQPPITEKAKPILLHEFTEPCREFTGRDKELQRIKESLSSWYNDKDRGNSVDRTFVIQGFGGMGKSNLAFKFAKDNLEAYDCIFQIGAETKETMVAGFQKLAQSLKLKLREKQQDITKEEVKQIYAEAAEFYKRVLIIFDNAERLHTTSETFGIFNYLANDAHIKNKPVFLVTTRNGGEVWEAHEESLDSVHTSQRLPIDFLGHDEAYECLLGQFRFKNEISEIGPELETCIRELAKLLGGYPLSMSLIARIIARKVRAEAFGEDLASQAKYYIELLSPHKIQEHESDQAHQARLSLIFKETLRQMKLEGDGDMAEKLLGMIAYLQPGASNPEFLNSVITKTEVDQNKPAVKLDELSSALKRGLKLLQAFSIISMNQERRNHHKYNIEFVQDKISVHRLVQEQAQTELVPMKLDIVKSFVEFYKVTNYSSSSLSCLHDGPIIEEVLLDHHEPKEVASQILAAFWQLAYLPYIPSFFGYNKQHEAQKLFFKKLQPALSLHLCVGEYPLLELGELYLKYETADESTTDPRIDSLRILEQAWKLGKEFLNTPWVLRACCTTMSRVDYHHKRRATEFERCKWDSIGYHSSFANWLYDQIIILNGTTTLAPWLQREVLDVFCPFDKVHIDSSTFIHVMKVLAPHVKDLSNFDLLSDYILRCVNYTTFSLSSTDKAEIMSIVCDMLAKVGEEVTDRNDFTWSKDWLGNIIFILHISEFLEQLWSRDGYGAAASDSERFVSRYEFVMKKLFYHDREILYKHFAICFALWFALWANREASEETVTHMNKFFSTLPYGAESSIHKYLVTQSTCRRSKEGVSNFIRKFEGKPNLNKKLIKVAELVQHICDDISECSYCERPADTYSDGTDNSND